VNVTSRIALFGAIAQRLLGKIYGPYFEGSKPIGPICKVIACTEISVRNYQYSLLKSPEECCSHLLYSGNLKSRERLNSFCCLNQTSVRCLISQHASHYYRMRRLRSQISLVLRRRCQSIHKHTVKDTFVLKGLQIEGDSNVVFFYCTGSFLIMLTRKYC
jgi:hypothetical protein